MYSVKQQKCWAPKKQVSSQVTINEVRVNIFCEIDTNNVCRNVA